MSMRVLAGNPSETPNWHGVSDGTRSSTSLFGWKQAIKLNGTVGG